ncbi:HET-domain-containing protein [Xylariaceae sp. AK1471]|nr:HET-domain-containing protein [Xylariaceae sp. AK1471]
MRLINTQSLDLEEFQGTAVPQYAILSHTWEEEEVTFQDWHDRDSAAKKLGYKKIIAACHQAKADNLGYLWVDTNCIDKTSSAELSEAINSMFSWYRNSDRCYVYLADIVRNGYHLASMGEASLLEFLPRPSPSNSAGDIDLKKLRLSRWFTRGWTLQELLAPSVVIFFDLCWQKVGEKGDSSFCRQLSMITGIDVSYLFNSHGIISASISERMSWLALRKTTRKEDLAYCMLGIFGINMPLLYGEGSRAFFRLQEEIIRISNDQTIFCWSYPEPARTDLCNSWSVLAPDPYAFLGGAQYTWNPEYGINTDYSLTNNGLSVTLPVIQTIDGSLIVLLAARKNNYKVAIVLASSGTVLPRHKFCSKPLCIPSLAASNFSAQSLRLKYRNDPDWAEPGVSRLYPVLRGVILFLITNGDTRIRLVAHQGAYILFPSFVKGQNTHIQITIDSAVLSLGSTGAIILDVDSAFPVNNKKRLSVIIAYKQCKMGVRWHIEAVLEGSLKSPTLAVGSICEKLQNSESLTKLSEVSTDGIPYISQANEGGRLAVAFMSGRTLLPLLDKCFQDDLEWYKSNGLVREPQTRKPRVGALELYSSFLNRKHKNL